MTDSLNSPISKIFNVNIGKEKLARIYLQSICPRNDKITQSKLSSKTMPSYSIKTQNSSISNWVIYNNPTNICSWMSNMIFITCFSRKYHL